MRGAVGFPEALGMIFLTAALGLFGFARWKPIPEDADYVGSRSCGSCHGSAYARWEDSQHTKMMRPVNAPGVLVADFATEDPGRRFELADAVWAIGGKWEQQFMGRDANGAETLLPGAWLHLTGRWDFKGWDGWEVPIPLRRCHGCHTVGLDVEAGHFVEPNIGCESCHGPGGWHVRTLGVGRIHVGADARVCGQCHTRGTAPSGAYFFPVGYRPGADLDEFFVHSQPSPGQTSTEWWGNGHERTRHQEYGAWRQGGHSQSLEHLREGYDGRYGALTESCLGCHAGDYILSPDGKLGVEEVREGITCSVCHNVHGALDEPRLTCDACHVEGPYQHEPERNADHVPCPPEAGVGCVSCHMPKSVTVGGTLALHSHAPGFVPPADTLAWGMPSGCANGGCHADVDPAELQRRFETHYRPAKAVAETN